MRLPGCAGGGSALGGFRFRLLWSEALRKSRRGHAVIGCSCELFALAYYVFQRFLCMRERLILRNLLHRLLNFDNSQI